MAPGGRGTPRSPAARFVLLALAMLTALTGLLTLESRATAAAARVNVTLTLYWGDGCPKCEAERHFLDDLRRAHPDLRVEQFEVWKDSGNRARFENAARQHGVSASVVPMTIVQGRVWVGYTDAIRDDMRSALEAALRGERIPAGIYGRTGEGTCTDATYCTSDQKPKAEVDVPLIGRVNVGDKSLIVSTLVIGFVDGINPCSLWVISILLAIVIRTGSRRRVVAIGSVFLLVTAGMYAAYMAGMYSALSVIGYLDAIQIAIGVVAAIFGVIAVKDYFWFKRGISLTIPEGSKPGIYKRMREVAASQSLPLALAATTGLAVGVSLIETPCTAGFPLLWTGLLASNHVGPVGSVLLYTLYMIPFLLDEMIVFTLAVTTMRATKLQEKHGRLLKLVAGVVMLALAGAMIFFPDVIEDLLGATLIFAVSIALALVIHAITRRSSDHHPHPRPAG